MSKLIGTDPNQVPSNADLGTLAFQDAEFPEVQNLRLRGSMIIGDEATAAANVLGRNLTVPEGSSGDLFLFGPSPEIGFFDANANRASAIDGNDGHIKFYSNVGSGTGGADAIVDGTEKATSGTNSLQTIQFNRIARDGVTGLYSSGGDIDILLGELRMGGSTVIRDADTIGIAHDGAQLDTANLIIGNDDTNNNTVSYGMKIIRHGNGGAGGAGTWNNSTSAIAIHDTAGQGPSSVETTAGIFTISMGRMSPADTDAEKGSIINITYDGVIGPMRLDGKGNLFVGWDRSNAYTNTNSFQVIARGGLIAGANSNYQTANASQGALIYGDVGIGTNAPGSKLDVRGDIRLDGSTTNRTLYFRNQQTAGSVQSDKGLLLRSGISGVPTTMVNIEEGGGYIVFNGVREYRKAVLLTNNVSYTFDIDIKNVSGSGAIYEIFAGYTHYSTSYGAVLKEVGAHRSNVQSDYNTISTIVNHSTGNAGAWSVSYVDATTIRITKSAGSYGGGGYGYILVRGAE